MTEFEEKYLEELKKQHEENMKFNKEFYGDPAAIRRLALIYVLIAVVGALIFLPFACV